MFDLVTTRTKRITRK